MSHTCKACMKLLPENFAMCHHCKGEYHYTPCAGMTEIAYTNMTKARRAEWRCTSCRMTTRLKATNDNNDDTTKKRSREEEELELVSPNNNKQKQLKPEEPNDDIKNDLREIKLMIRDMNNRLSTENNTLKEDMNRSFKSFNETIGQLTTQIGELMAQNMEKDEKIATLENKINNIEQRSLQNNLEISNVPMKEDEDITAIVRDLTSKIDVKITDLDINDAYRDRKQNIIIKLANYWKKREIMSKAKKKPININNTKIYINDQLTPYKKKLLWQTKTTAKLHKWQYVWVKGGNIFAKKNEESNTFYITEEKNIENISS